MDENLHTTLAAAITKQTSERTFATIYSLVDRELIPDAYRAYAYFRWVDDSLDKPIDCREERLDFVKRQKEIMEQCYQGDRPTNLSAEEVMLADLIQNDPNENGGLRLYTQNLMTVMDFDANRRGRLISELELSAYSRMLATAVTEALHYFIGHNSFSPQDDTRYLAATGAHITHMLRDTAEDISVGYYNIPSEYLYDSGIAPWDIQSDPYRAWVRERVELARSYFGAGKAYLVQVEEQRCRIAGNNYIAHFEPILDAIEQNDYLLPGKFLGTGKTMPVIGRSLRV